MVAIRGSYIDNRNLSESMLHFFLLQHLLKNYFTVFSCHLLFFIGKGFYNNFCFSRQKQILLFIIGIWWHVNVLDIFVGNYITVGYCWYNTQKCLIVIRIFGCNSIHLELTDLQCQLMERNRGLACEGNLKVTSRSSIEVSLFQIG